LKPCMEVKDSNGNVLKDGDSVVLIKDLKVKGAGTTLKRGTKTFVYSPHR
jgi:protein PhnA